MPMFNYIPDVKYDVKPVQYPFTQSDFITAKNFFRRFELNPDVYNYALYYTKYAVLDGERIDNVAQKFYNRSSYDWIIVITNNIINPLTDWPMSDNRLERYVKSKYDNIDDIHHYEIYQDSGDTTVTIELPNDPATTIPVDATAITNAEYEEAELEKKRRIRLIRPQFVDQLKEEFRKSIRA